MGQEWKVLFYCFFGSTVSGGMCENPASVVGVDFSLSTADLCDAEVFQSSKEVRCNCSYEIDTQKILPEAKGDRDWLWFLHVWLEARD